MAASQDPNLGIHYGWTLGESGWNAQMDANLKKLGAIAQLSVKSRAADVPATPANGDRYIVPAGATGDWSGKDGEVAVRVAGVWEFHAPAEGWTARVMDEAADFIHASGAWIRKHPREITHQLAVKSRATDIPASPSEGDRYIIPAAATGDWAGKDGQVAAHLSGAWEYYPPAIGWRAYIEDEEVLSVYKSAGWSAGIAI